MEDVWLGLAVVLPLTIVAGGVLVILMAMYQRTRLLEMRHRERLAMIERGLVPPDEQERASNAWGASPSRDIARPRSRYTSLGVAIVGVGLGLMLMIGVAGGAPDAGIGVGGAVAILGLAFIVNGYLQRGADVPRHQPAPRPSPMPPPLGPSDPPGPIAP